MSDTLMKAADLYSKTSRGTGNREYLVGYLGGLKVLIFRVNNPEPDGPTHTLFVTARPERKPRSEPRDGQ